MQRPTSLIRVFLFLPACGFFFLVVSQDLKKTTEQIRKEYQQAFSYYHEANKLANSPSYKEQAEMLLNRKALNGLKQVLPAVASSALRSDSLMFRISFTIGELEHYFENYQGALDYYDQAVASHRGSGLPDSVLFKPLLYSGLIYYNRGKIDSAASFFLKADTIQQHYPLPLDESQRLYNTLGVLSYEAGDYRQARNYFRRALELIKKDDPYYDDLKSNYLINLAQVQVKLQDYNEAFANYEQLVLLQRNLDEVYYNMGLIRVEQGRGKDAIAFLDKVNFDGAKKLRLYNSFARAYLAMGEKLICRNYLAESKRLYEVGEKDLTSYGVTLKVLGDLAVAEDSATLAIRYYTDAIHCFYPAYQDSSVNRNPQRFNGFFSYINLYRVLIDKARAWHQLYGSSGDTAHAALELDTYRSAYALLSHVMETYETDEARIFINSSRYQTHDQPISIAYDLYNKTKDQKYLEELYAVDQQNKASVLAFNALGTRAEGREPLAQEVQDLKKQITRLVLRSATAKDSKTLSQLNSQILDLELKLTKLRSGVKRGGSVEENLPSVKFIQQNLLDHSTTLISYHLGTGHITTTLITKKNFKVTRKKLDEGFSNKVGQFIKAVQSPGARVPQEISIELYHLLFNDVQGENAERLIIIPDDELTYLPFESLQNEEGTFALENYSIQYQYSTAFLKEQGSDAVKGNAISFAPFASAGTAGFSPLPFSKEEIDGNQGMRYYDNKAEKSVFLRESGKAALIHLATHARAGSGTGASFLVFKNKTGETDYLYEEEIYNLDLRKTGLVILSACETGSGELMKGEGVMSLSRAFRYAGCENIITSLWKADDRSTSYITKKIHHYLDKGYSMDLAVSQAKLDLLGDETINPRNKHPYYWSHLVFIGNYQPHKNTNWVQMLIILVSVLVALTVFRRFWPRKPKAL